MVDSQNEFVFVVADTQNLVSKQQVLRKEAVEEIQGLDEMLMVGLRRKLLDLDLLSLGHSKRQSSSAD